MKNIVVFICFLIGFSATSQTLDSVPVNELTLNEFLGYVKLYHPVARQAQLKVNMAQAELLKSRGAFDPKIEVDYDRKEFKGSEYYDILNGSFKIPTWFGIELKAGFEQNEGVFLNPQLTVPEDGLYSAGISVPLGQGLFINERMATLRQAKVYRELSKAERDLQLNQILTDAALTYFEWFKSYNEVLLYDSFLENARIRYEGIKKRVIAGDIAAIDSLEAGITIKNRKLSFEQAKVKLMKAGLELSNFLWLEGNIPLEVQSDVIPENDLLFSIDQTLKINNELAIDFNLEEHPKIKALDYKIRALQIDRRFKADKLKPRIDVNYNFLTSDAGNLNSINSGDYKGGILFRFPLFLRKERGALKLAKFKIQDAQFNYDLESLRLTNKISAGYQELQSLERQILLIERITQDYGSLLTAEERKFSFGESSVFLINSRERSLLTSRLKQIELYTKIFNSKASLFQSLATQL
ncbi:TolC family protein [Ascidiimonas sp. W6]|uniref:TolC family protein n=1 Tax=Ascidiimonas meishanensis TaxID=3128903 RepID=UPI0030EBC2C0